LEFYAKKYGNNYETIESHTKLLIKELDALYNIYRNEINNLKLDNNIYNYIKTACIFHDLGKYSDYFQYNIKNEKKPLNLKDIKHNYLSIAFIYEYLAKNYNNDIFYKLFYAIAFHHDRKIDFNKDDLNAYQNGLNQKINYLTWVKDIFPDFEIKNLRTDYYGYLKKYYDDKLILLQNKTDIKKDKDYIFLKGMLHKLDYAASAHLSAEENKIINFNKKFNKYLNSKNIKLKNFQKKSKNNSDKSLLLIAPTGSGKTEFAINWLNGNKGFYILPLRVSTNAMYERFNSIFKDNIGLLHGDSLFYKLEEKNNIDEHINNIKLARQLSMPITITTADQLFPAVFKYYGYERIYATLMYSKIIIDEPQSYSPEMLAIIVKMLDEISNYNGKFCLMSATIHPILLNKIKQIKNTKIINLFNNPKFNPLNKHKIQFTDQPIENLINNIINSYKNNKKVLVIANTVKQSQNLYRLLNKYKEEYDKNLNIKLVHSQFIQKDRIKKEADIFKDAGNTTNRNNNPIIWISTQIIEASLDVDFDILYTEISSIDSLIQRMGRVCRRFDKTINKKDTPNIIISLQPSKGTYNIYNKQIVEFTIKELSNYNDKILTEHDKQNIINNVFLDNDNEFNQKFKKSIELLESGYTEDNKNDALRSFRDINTENVIPYGVFENNKKEIEKNIDILKNNKKLNENKIKALNELNGYMVNVYFYKLNNHSSYNRELDARILNYDYNETTGIDFEKIKEEDFFI
jgi:CRISPR-associated endonuclease/helicase Cas3